MYSCVLFDMDGTLINSYAGIFHGYQRAFAQLGENFPGEDLVRRAIGAPLPEVFERLCGFRPEQTRMAVRYYRQYYDEKGKHEAFAYAGIADTLSRLKAAGYFLGTATLKKEAFALEMLEELELLFYFDAVCGADADGRLAKADLIQMGMDRAGARPQQTVLVGDSLYDAEGARQAGVAFLAVTYGFGFRSAEEARQEPGVSMVARNPEEIARLLCS